MKSQILLVEDNQTDEKLTIRAFNRCGVPSDIVVMRDGAAALDYLLGRLDYPSQDVSLMPRVVLLDLSLPRVNGLEVLKALRADERTALLPIVVLSSSLEEEDLMRSYQLGANAYVRKPVDYAEFFETAKALSLFWLQVNEVPPTR